MGFNGTTFFQTWKSALRFVAGFDDQVVLQWNHVFSNVEIIDKTFTFEIGVWALQWNHVFSNVEIGACQ